MNRDVCNVQVQVVVSGLTCHYLFEDVERIVENIDKKKNIIWETRNIVVARGGVRSSVLWIGEP